MTSCTPTFKGCNPPMADYLQCHVHQRRADGAFNSLARHLYWFERYHCEQKPDRNAPDIADIRERDLPDVIVAVESWGCHFADASLVKAISAPWEAQHFGSAVRDAFIHLEDVLREVGNVDLSSGLSGDRLVAQLLGPSSSSQITLPTDGFMSHLR